MDPLDEEITAGGICYVMVTGKPRRYFEQKGFRQGDPLSPLLFSLVIDALSAMLNKGKEKDILEGLGEHMMYKGVLNVHCSEDTVLFSQG